ncbi:DUF378 domain-containing protein [Acinetobacter kookii]|uniref:DUF378 domain-containing protein n=1 Tax=unclassified Acinetobacter TaxID=196816 RepID=UPI0021B82D52|nr:MULTISPECIES: DUF378 domain-containing protein [unclassified Acinetobacter]MCT8088927.1 DUF378 domain-containing protein [Acinetobacter sp. F_3_1]MCT8097083.1 DUF378 domain-containing protein [Acinetobacter sp. C_3_1]MCT8099924.1 DUF378 domain-containing protein [Acinetobacter sp. C_4_1]MCT8134323.1 DUF378 domain-containing protein [Acinetobacter sp. T_3_1]
MRLNTIDWIAYALAIIGGLNWGLIGAFDFNLVAAIFGEMSVLTRIIYILVGLSALYLIYTGTKLGRTVHHEPQTRVVR